MKKKYRKKILKLYIYKVEKFICMIEIISGAKLLSGVFNDKKKIIL
jgi:hypothetical protein